MRGREGAGRGLVGCLRTVDLLDVDVLPEALLQRRLPGAPGRGCVPQLLRVLEQLGLLPSPLGLGIRVFGSGLWWFRRGTGRAEGGDVGWVGGRVVEGSGGYGLGSQAVVSAGDYEPGQGLASKARGRLHVGRGWWWDVW